MNAIDIASAVLFAGIGGFIGAVATAVVAGGRLAGSWNSFSAELRAYLDVRTDPPSRRLAESFEAVERDFRSTLAALRRIRLKR